MGKTVILDNGHGGMINNEYQTAGKRSPDWPQGILYEGMFNRWVVNRIIERLDRMKIPYYHISPEFSDVTLETRRNRANRIYDINPDVWLLSIHANAGGGTGIEAFTTVGQTSADGLANIVLSNLETDMHDTHMRFDLADGDKDKEMNFYILKQTVPPAVLVELGFMDQRIDYDRLWDEAYLANLVNSLVKSIREIWG